MFNSFRNFKPVKRLQNRSDVSEFWNLDNNGTARRHYALFRDGHKKWR